MNLESLVPWRRNTSLVSDPFSSEPLTSISSLQREMNRMFNNIWSTPSMASRIAPSTEAAFFHPEVEMSETNGHIEVSAEIPGVTEKDIDLTLSPDGKTLALKGVKKLSKEKKDKDYYYAERSYGEFRRTMTLPSPVNPDKVDAKFHNGVLEIKLTKVEDSSKGVKRIAIKGT